MSGLFSAGGLITGIDTNSLVSQLMQIERQPILRMQDQITALEAKQTAINSLRTELSNFRNTLQDFRFGGEFNKFKTENSVETVATSSISGPNPTPGAFSVNVIQLASATIGTSNGRIGASIDPAVAFDSSGINTEVTSGDFSINGEVFTFDFSVSSLDDVIAAVNSSGIGVTASYDSLTDKVTFANTNPADTSIINFGAVDDTSNFLDVIGVDGAYQYTNGSGSTEVASSVGLGNIDQNISLDSQNYGVGVMTGGSFKINGITITVDPAVDGLSDVIERINASNAGVTVSYDSNTDGLRVVSDNLGSRTMSFTSGTSNFLDVMNLTSATQVAGTDSQFTIDGGPVLTRNSNDISDVIGGVTISMKSIGASTITVNQDVDAGIAVVQEFVDGFNNSIQQIADAISDTGNLKGDFSIRSIKNELQSLLYESISGAADDRNNILDIGISSGSAFDSTAVFKIEIDDEVLREAFTQGATSVENIFVNDAETGIGDLMFSYLDNITETFGFLNDRSKANGSIDLQIQSLRDRIDSSEERLVIKEQRLRSSFIRMEQLSSQYQSQASSFNNFASGF